MQILFSSTFFGILGFIFVYFRYLCEEKNVKIYYYLPALLFATCVFYSTWSLQAFSMFILNTLDGALRMLPHYYVQNGFIPYHDFGFVYPPGLILLFGKIIPFYSIYQRNFLIAIIFLILVSYGIWFLYKLNRGDNKKFIICCVLYLLANIINLGIFGILQEPFSLTLLGLLIFHCCRIWLNANQKNLTSLIVIAIISSIMIFFRWDFIVGIFLVNLTAFIIFTIYQKFQKNSVNLIQLSYPLIMQFCGIFCGIILLIAYLHGIGALRDGLNFIFLLPIVITPKLLLFTNFKYPILVPTIFTILSSIFILRVYKKQEKYALKFLLLTLALLPYSFASYAVRIIEISHQTPLLYITTISLLIVFSLDLINKKHFTILFLIAFFSYFMNFSTLKMSILTKQYSYSLSLLPASMDNKNYLARDTEKSIKDCQTKTQNITPKIQSIFVGRPDYSGYWINNQTNLYLIDPNVKPAMPFITDEYNLQASCYYGNIITQQLKNAPKPMLALIETSKSLETTIEESNVAKIQIPFNSCGYIENFLKNAHYKSYGTCKTNSWIDSEREYEIRLYE